MKRTVSIILALCMIFTLCSCASSDYKKAVELMESRQYGEAMKLFADLGDYEDSAENWKFCCYSLAREYLLDADYESAINLFEKIPGYSDSSECLRQCRYNQAVSIFRSFGWTPEVEENFLMCGGYKNTDKYCICHAMSLLFGSDSPDYAGAAACLEQVQAKEGKTLFTTCSCLAADDPKGALKAVIDSGSGIFEKYSAESMQGFYEGGREVMLKEMSWNRLFFPDNPDYLTFNLDTRITYEFIKKIDSGTDYYGSPQMHSRDFASECETDRFTFRIDSVDSLRAMCGAAPEGKVLVVKQTMAYPDGEITQGVFTEWMKLLPDELKPVSLAEVEYIIVIAHSYTPDGTYTRREYQDGVVSTRTEAGIKLSCTVSLVSVADGSILYESGEIPGEALDTEDFNAGTDGVDASGKEYHSVFTTATPDYRPCVSEAVSIIQKK